ncbi:hypothetical protein Droror1_Dr00024404 [Drosera rotundifolia]
MVGPNLKSETLTLMDKRSAIESEMNSIIDRLSVPGGPGISGNLLDSEGFPRDDIDIPAVRADRNRLAALKNDHKDLTERIDKNIQLLHATKLAKTPVSTDSGNYHMAVNQDSHPGDALSSASSIQVIPRDGPTAMDTDINTKVPFAVIDEITEGSPAAEDGLQLGDQVLKFGIVEYGDNLLARLSSELQANKDCAVPLVVIRQGAQLSFSITPRTWSGRGLLGCHFRIL